MMLFGSDAVKSTMQIVSLYKSGNKSKAVRVWLMRGLINQILAYLIDWIGNDEDPPEWEDYLAGILLGPANGIPLLGAVSETIESATGGTKFRFGGTGRAIFDPVGAVNGMRKILKMAEDEKDHSWIDYAKASLNVAKSGSIAGAGALKYTARGKAWAEQVYSGLMITATGSNLLKFLVNTADKLDWQDEAKDRKEEKAKLSRERNG